MIVSLTIVMVAGCGAGRAIEHDVKHQIAVVGQKVQQEAGRALKELVCDWVTTRVDKGRSPSNKEWDLFVISEQEKAHLGFSFAELQEKADELMATLKLTGNNPDAAVVYAKSCPLAGGRSLRG
jgi:hypothetical protein